MQQKQVGFYYSQKQSNEVRQGNIRTHGSESKQGQQQNHDKESSQKQVNLLELLLKPEQSDNSMPYELSQKKRKKKQSKGLRL